jgi:hypothetical protein
MIRQDNLARMTHAAEGAADLAVQGQRMAMSVLFAEMQALSAILPGYWAPSRLEPPQADAAAAAEARHRLDEARQEETFDNMPV